MTGTRPSPTFTKAPTVRSPRKTPSRHVSPGAGRLPTRASGENSTGRAIATPLVVLCCTAPDPTRPQTRRSRTGCRRCIDHRAGLGRGSRAPGEHRKRVIRHRRPPHGLAQVGTIRPSRIPRCLPSIPPTSTESPDDCRTRGRPLLSPSPPPASPVATRATAHPLTTLQRRCPHRPPHQRRRPPVAGQASTARWSRNRRARSSSNPVDVEHVAIGLEKPVRRAPTAGTSPTYARLRPTRAGVISNCAASRHGCAFVRCRLNPSPLESQSSGLMTGPQPYPSPGAATFVALEWNVTPWELIGSDARRRP